MTPSCPMTLWQEAMTNQPTNQPAVKKPSSQLSTSVTQAAAAPATMPLAWQELFWNDSFRSILYESTLILCTSRCKHSLNKQWLSHGSTNCELIVSTTQYRMVFHLKTHVVYCTTYDRNQRRMGFLMSSGCLHTMLEACINSDVWECCRSPWGSSSSRTNIYCSTKEQKLPSPQSCCCRCSVWGSKKTVSTGQVVDRSWLQRQCTQWQLLF